MCTRFHINPVVTSSGDCGVVSAMASDFKKRSGSVSVCEHEVHQLFYDLSQSIRRLQGSSSAI